MSKLLIKKSLLKKLKKIKNKDAKAYKNILKKIDEIINSNNINHYKNLKEPLSHLKRVHLNKHFVLLFKYDNNKEIVEFIDYLHHDDAYL